MVRGWGIFSNDSGCWGYGFFDGLGELFVWIKVIGLFKEGREYKLIVIRVILFI